MLRNIICDDQLWHSGAESVPGIELYEICAEILVVILAKKQPKLGCASLVHAHEIGIAELGTIPIGWQFHERVPDRAGCGSCRKVASLQDGIIAEGTIANFR